MRILLLTHGGWGMDLMKGIRMILGPVDFVEEFPLYPQDTLQDYLARVEKGVKELPNNSLLLADLFGGTTANVGTLLARKYGQKLFTGLNASMLLEACSQIMNCSEINYDSVLEAGQGAVIDTLEELKNRKNGGD